MIESAEGGNLWRKGLFIQGETKNHNGRVYPLTEIDRAVKTLTEKIKQMGPVIGELDHPDGLNINLKWASHAITEMWMDGSNGLGKMKVIKAGYGLIVHGLVEAGVNLGVSSRGSGAVGSNGIVSEFEIVTIDIVANPSAPNAHPAAIRESLERSRYGRETMNLAEWAQGEPSAQKYFAKALSGFLVEIRDEVTWRKR